MTPPIDPDEPGGIEPFPKSRKLTRHSLENRLKKEKQDRRRAGRKRGARRG